jgi:hypothetical protein
VFVIVDRQSVLVRAFPPSTIDFDTSKIPDKLCLAFQEALACHAIGAYVASAMLVRKSLECLCDDRGAQGKDLHARLGALRAKVTLPELLFEAMGALKLLGNDAAHVDARTYDEIGQEEVEAAIDLTKEILKAVYQYESLLTRLTALKKGAAT